jgi:hypothetical protein
MKEVCLCGFPRGKIIFSRTNALCKEVRKPVPNDKTVICEIAETSGVQGFAIAPELGRGFASNGREAKASIVDLQTLKPFRKLKRGKIQTRSFTCLGASKFTRSTGADIQQRYLEPRQDRS